MNTLCWYIINYFIQKSLNIWMRILVTKFDKINLFAICNRKGKYLLNLLQLLIINYFIHQKTNLKSSREYLWWRQDIISIIYEYVRL